MKVHVGLDVSGVLDRGVAWREETGTPETLREAPIPATVIVPDRGTARVPALAGGDAAEAVEGRGWSWPKEATLETGRRIPVLALWQSLCAGGGAVEDQRHLRDHLRALLPKGARQAVLAIPDPLDESGQQRLLDAARMAGLELTLLWRPVAAVLGLDACMDDAARHAWAGRRVLVLHLGIDRAEAALLDVQVEQGVLTPERFQDGRLAHHWPGEELAEETAKTAAEAAGGGPQLRWQMHWGTGHAWRAMLGRPPQLELFQRADGRWFLADGAPRLPADAREEFEARLEELLTAVAGADGRIGRMVVEGPLVDYPLSPTARLGDLAGSLARRMLDLPGEHVHLVRGTDPLIARGTAACARREANGLPTYFDFLPQLEINAVRHRRAVFVDLVRHVSRIPGGQAYRATLDGFAVDESTQRLMFYLAREGDQIVRRLTTTLPNRAGKRVGITLHVEQRPAAGHAVVEVVPAERGLFGHRPLRLDWRTLEATGETRKEALARLQREIGFAYPDPAPMPAHADRWQANGVADAILSFLDTPLESPSPDRLNNYLARATALPRLFTRRPLPRDLAEARSDFRSYSLVSSDGELPADIDARLGPPPHFSDHASLLASLLNKAGRDFGLLCSMPASKPVVDARRQLYVLAAWCYAAAPASLRRYVLDEASRGGEQWTIEACGRCLHEPEELGAFFAAAASILPTHPAPYRWIKALGLILAYRDHAAEFLTSRQACLFARAAVRLMREELESRELKRRFFAALYLLLGLLRYRITDPHFLLQEQLSDVSARQCGAKFVAMLKRRLAEAEHVARSGKHRRLIAEIERFIDERGTVSAILVEVGEEAKA